MVGFLLLMELLEHLLSSTIGAYSSSSDRNKKDSIRKKDVSEKNKDYLDRI